MTVKCRAMAASEGSSSRRVEKERILLYKRSPRYGEVAG